jgi:hypothetical protein
MQSDLLLERTFGWLMRYRRLCRDYEKLPEHHEAMVWWATVFIMTRRLARYENGHPDPPRWGGERLRPAQQAALSTGSKGVSVFAIGVGANADMVKLKELSVRSDPVRLDGLKFAEFFKWLSASLSAASQSYAHGSDDSAIAGKDATEQIALPTPRGWAVV